MSINKNIERAFDTIICGSFYYEKDDSVRAYCDGSFYYRGTKIAQAIYDDSNDNQFILLPTLDFKTDKGWKIAKRAIAKYANKFDYYVIITDDFDFGFKQVIPKLKDWYDPLSTKEIYSKLLEIAKYSQDKDIKTAACVIEPGLSEVPDKILAYSYNQKLNKDNEYTHAEKILTLYTPMISDFIFQTPKWYSLLEPCDDCLKSMIEAGAEEIYYGQLHKDKWNSENYIQLTNDIFNKTILSKQYKPIKYKLILDKRIEHFYNKGGNK